MFTFTGHDPSKPGCFPMEIPVDPFDGRTEQVLLWYRPELFEVAAALQAARLQGREVSEQRSFQPLSTPEAGQIGHPTWLGLVKLRYHIAGQELPEIALGLDTDLWVAARDRAIAMGLARVVLVITGDPLFLRGVRNTHAWITHMGIAEIEGAGETMGLMMQDLQRQLGSDFEIISIDPASVKDVLSRLSPEQRARVQVQQQKLPRRERRQAEREALRRQAKGRHDQRPDHP